MSTHSPVSMGYRDVFSQRRPNLMTKVTRELVESDFPLGSSSWYLPPDSIDKLVTRDAIIQELDLTAGDLVQQYEWLVQWILTEARRVFLTVIESGICGCPHHKVASMKWFCAHGLNDHRLPWIDWDSFPTITPVGDEQIWCHDTWDLKIMNNCFKRCQWKFLVPVICSRHFMYKLHPEQLLPLTRVNKEEMKEGAFGRVYHVEIHRLHIDQPVTQIAVKEIMITAKQKRAVEDAWPNELRVLKTIKRFGNPHLIHCIAAIERGNGRFLLFPWAQGGNLREYWEGHSGQVLSRDLVKEALVQLEGLADALRELHYFGLDDDSEDLPSLGEDGILEEYSELPAHKSIRHGDLKPENLLWFLDVDNTGETRRLKIADMGLAKRHVVATQDRSCLTSTRYGTIIYEAPEAQTAMGNQARSRQYDIWSMGCITLEWIIWLLYGNVQLERFYHQLRGNSDIFTPYYTLDVGSGVKRATLRPPVVHWISHIKNTHPECQRASAINDLLKLVEERLLVVPLPIRRPTTLLQNRPQGTQSSLPEIHDGKVRYRATSKEFQGAMQRILQRVRKSDGYTLTSTGLASAAPPQDMQTLLHPENAITKGKHVSKAPGMPQQGGLAPPSTAGRLENWQYPVDNQFAQEAEREIGYDAPAHPTCNLCDRCYNLDFWRSDFHLQESSHTLKQTSRSCEMCQLLWTAWFKAHGPEGPGAVVHFERAGSIIKMIGAKSLPALSILRSIDGPESASGIQVGMPQLFQPRSDRFFGIVRKWLHDCDSKHTDCQFDGESTLPTRLVDLGSLEHPILRLVETESRVPSDSKYVALSHRWGDMKNNRPFCTRLEDSSGKGHDFESFKQAIPYADVPQTFRDAIETTRRLGVRYLWIDSLCIIQGNGGDFVIESKRMEDVFSCAYCVIAASRASNQLEGFLGERPQRQYLAIQRNGEPPLYVCEAIDDFGSHVLDGALNRRGWVLQERALARRTVYFADVQTYFECGQGVRCETLTKMQNNMADFLGDARFPDKAMRTKSRALKIRYFQDLYRRYSHLEFSHIQDRPVAIAGLENRLRKAFWTKGGYGIFDDGPGCGLFHRSLLWQRSEDEPVLETIDFSERPEHAMPSWSWMAFKGGIDYLDPPFQKVDWEEAEVKPPWTQTSGGSDDSHSSHYLQVGVRSFNVAGYQPGEIRLVYDNPERRATSEGQRPMCVIIAKLKQENLDQDKIHYVLIVLSTPGLTPWGQRIFTRLGVGYMPGKYIGLEGHGQEAVVG
ncbi:hypothetical protein FZEAL_1826 [Fusarium zealandicum]|uniref:Protein kinase domain-containing protein n=1 Tax=Fusarium zealandicum TaxID=1053134 RepID=A0A8H4US99_9HYPO|nr:hypothetical protein FZEAL_1826 [Fusarium zealandicum]